MKQLIFIRHAKSDWGSEFLHDADRCLNERGYSDAYYMSRWFKKNHKATDVIISSTATRALSTALIFARDLDFNMNNFFLEQKIYEAPMSRLISVIKNLNNEKDSAMLFGHNPGFTNVCNELSADMFYEGIPTCGIVSMKFDIESWNDVKPHSGKLDFYQFPKDFKNYN